MAKRTNKNIAAFKQEVFKAVSQDATKAWALNELSAVLNPEGTEERHSHYQIRSALQALAAEGSVLQSGVRRGTRYQVV